MGYGRMVARLCMSAAAKKGWMDGWMDGWIWSQEWMDWTGLAGQDGFSLLKGRLAYKNRR
jgi:hypothetical protein